MIRPGFTGKFILLFISALCSSISAAQSVSSGNIEVSLSKERGKGYGMSLSADGFEHLATLTPGFPVSLEVNGQPLSGRYDSYKKTKGRLECKADIETSNGSIFAVNDIYIPGNEGAITLRRKIEVVKADVRDSCFNSFFGFITNGATGKFTDNEFFVPGVWYKNNFAPDGNLPRHVPRANDTYFYYRADRITLPLVMFRDPHNGSTLSITHMNCSPQTVIADSENIRINSEYQYGALGVRHENGNAYTTFVYPGSEHQRSGGHGYRSHPVAEDVKHEYELEIRIINTPDYPSAVKNTWTHAFELYNPPVHEVDLQYTYDGLIETLMTYYAPDSKMGGIRDAAGFPFQVSLTTFEVMGINYQMGFVGMQVATGYYIFREGIEKGDPEMQKKGEAVLDFWANECLTELGMPRIWYDPGLNGRKGNWRKVNNLRSATGGMESLIAAWSFATKNGLDRSNWIEACEKYGNWMSQNQNPDGSFYYAHDHARIVDGKHPVMVKTEEGQQPQLMDYKSLTICAVRYLVELYIATGDERYKQIALRAGEYCYKTIHEKYSYVSGVVDNPQTIDSESGQMAINGFLALYDLTGEKKWLDAAEQAAVYTETWVYCYEIPVEKDREFTVFPRDRSVVGQHLIAIGHAAADLGFAWLSFPFYRLYIETGDEHYLHVSRISAHNTKQTMNWNGTLYPGQPHGLQLEAYPVMIPRRGRGVQTCLNWNYAAHLDPMFRFKDAFGTPDLEKVEKFSTEERDRLNETYRKVQSADHGQIEK